MRRRRDRSSSSPPLPGCRATTRCAGWLSPQKSSSTAKEGFPFPSAAPGSCRLFRFLPSVSSEAPLFPRTRELWLLLTCPFPLLVYALFPFIYLRRLHFSAALFLPPDMKEDPFFIPPLPWRIAEYVTGIFFFTFSSPRYRRSLLSPPPRDAGF